MNRILSIALASLIAAPAFAATGTGDPAFTPEREIERQTAPQSTVTGPEVQVPTDEVYDPQAAAMIDQPTVERTIFDDQAEVTASDAQTPGQRYR